MQLASMLSKTLILKKQNVILVNSIFSFSHYVLCFMFFILLETNINFLVTLISSSACAFNLDQSKISLMFTIVLPWIMGISYDTILIFNTAFNHVKTCRKRSTKFNSIYKTLQERLIVFKSLSHFKTLKKECPLGY